MKNDLFSRAQKLIPGGVNSPVRAFGAVGGSPVYMVSGSGAHLQTADDHQLLDYCGSWGPLLFGHAHPAIVEAVQRAAARGMSFGANTPAEVEFAERLTAMAPSLEMVRLVSSGTEAVMTALRLARGFTGRDKIIKFAGCYHGHSDSLLVNAGSGLLTGGIASSAGVPAALAAATIILPYNDLAAVDQAVALHGDDLAAIIVEPVAGNMGLILPEPPFLAGLRAAADRCGALLIFDEVNTGFRFGPTTYGHLSHITPDLTTLGKIIGGGMPLAALGGRRNVMSALAPLGKVYQAGTLSGNPVAVAAGIATLTLIENDPPYARLDSLGRQLAAGLNAAAAKVGTPFHCLREGGAFTPFFMASPPTNLDQAMQCDTAAHAQFFNYMLKQGIYLPPSQFETGFISAAHTPADIEQTVAAVTDWHTTRP